LICPDSLLSFAAWNVAPPEVGEIQSTIRQTLTTILPIVLLVLSQT